MTTINKRRAQTAAIVALFLLLIYLLAAWLGSPSNALTPSIMLVLMALFDEFQIGSTPYRSTALAVAVTGIGWIIATSLQIMVS